MINEQQNQNNFYFESTLNGIGNILSMDNLSNSLSISHPSSSSINGFVHNSYNDYYNPIRREWINVVSNGFVHFDLSPLKDNRQELLLL